MIFTTADNSRAAFESLLFFTKKKSRKNSSKSRKNSSKIRKNSSKSRKNSSKSRKISSKSTDLALLQSSESSLSQLI